MKTQTIEFDNGAVKARIVVSEASVLQGVKRTRLKYEAGDIDKITDPDLKLVRLLIYPELLAAARSIEIDGVLGDPSFDDFCQLPEPLAKQWEDAAFTLNPHWLPGEADEKKEVS